MQTTSSRLTLTLALLGATALGCSGIFGPRVDELTVTADPCGGWELAVPVFAHGERAQVLLDGVPVLDTMVRDQVTLRASGLAPPGLHQVEVSVASVSRSAIFTVDEPPIALRVAPAGELIAGFPGQVSVSLDTLCAQVVPLEVSAWSSSGPPTSVALRLHERVLLPVRLDAAGEQRQRFVARSDSTQLAAADVVLAVRAPSATELRTMDRDGDGSKGEAFGGDDCDDSDPAVHPGADEAAEANGRDDDCDGTIDEETIAYDDDGDGFSEQQGDCNDADAGRYPGAPELPDCRDQDCDGQIDEGAPAGGDDREFEPNDRKADAFDLHTDDVGSFTRTLALRTSSSSDEEWFSFFSRDDDWDLWHIDITMEQMSDVGAYELTLFREGQQKRTLIVHEREGIHRLGTFFQDGTGHWSFRLRPLQVPKGCPALVHVSSG